MKYTANSKTRDKNTEIGSQTRKSSFSVNIGNADIKYNIIQDGIINEVVCDATVDIDRVAKGSLQGDFTTLGLGPICKALEESGQLQYHLLKI